MKKLWHYLPAAGLYLYVFLLPWQTRLIVRQGYLNGGNWEYGTASLYGTEILLLLVLIIELFHRRKKTPAKRLGYDIALIAFLVIAGLSFLFSIKQELTLTVLIKLLEGVCLIWLVVRIPFSWRWLAQSWVAGALVQAGFGIWQFFSQQTIVNKWLGLAAHDPSQLGTFVIETGGERFLRAYGALPHPNMLAAWLALAIFLIFGLYFDLYRRIYHWFAALHPSQQKKFWSAAGNQAIKFSLEIVWYLVCLGVLTIGLLLTFSRGAWLACLIGIGVMAIVVVVKNDAKKFLAMVKLGIVIGVVSAATIAIMPQPFFTRFQPESRLEKISIDTRLTYQDQALTLLKKYWVVGTGLGTYTQAVHDKIDNSLKTWDYQPVHNIYLLVAVETSVIGLIVFGFLLFEVFRETVRRLKKSPAVDRWFAVIIGQIVFVVVMGWVDHFWWTLAFGVWVWWLVFGLWRREVTAKQ
ncbi:MAG: O-antigen ligase family protein [Patescibacteria group bacterium]